MSVSLIAYGQLERGNYGTLLDPTTGKPLASVIEVLETLPSIASSDNFVGRAVFDKATAVLYVFSDQPTSNWLALEGIPATVGSTAGVPPVSPIPQTGSLFYDLDTEVMFVWDGSAWQAVGGRYAATIVENSFVGDGVTLTFPSGSPAAIQSQYVEIFIDGVRQTATSDYNLVGTSVQFLTPPPSGTNVLIRAMNTQGVIQNAQVSSAVSIAASSQTDFVTGSSASDPAGVFVIVDGLFKALNTDYTLVQQDTSIVSLVKTSSTVARLTTTTAHGIPVGGSVTFAGVSEDEYNRLTFVVTNVPSTTTFDITVPSSAPTSATADPVMSYSPAFINDIVRFPVGMSGGESVDIRSLRNVVVSGAVGEVNTLSNIGSGIGVASTKVGEILQLKSLKAGANVAVTDNGSELVLSASNGLSFEDRVGINSSSHSAGNESWVGVRNTSTTVVIDLSTIAQDTQNSGRRIKIKDESGGAGVNSITISATPATIDGASTYVINQNYGVVELVMDGSNWFVAS